MSQDAVFECRSISVSFGTRFGVHPVLERLDLTVAAGHRIALVGENGSGKSTLLEVLAGGLAADDGSVRRPGTRIGVMDQLPPWQPDTRVERVLEHAIGWAHDLMADVEDASNEIARRPDDIGAAVRLATALTEAEAANAWRATDALDVLVESYVSDVDPHRRIEELSGGQRGRLQLVHLFAGQPGALLLDEPTTHLDRHVVEQLTAELRTFPGPVVFSSHDRQFIEDVATGVMDLDPDRGRPVVLPGGWQAYRQHRELRLSQWQRDFAGHRAAEDLARSAGRAATRARRVAKRPDNDKVIAHRKEQRASATRAARTRRAAQDLRRLEDNRVVKPPRTLELRAASLAVAGPTGVLVSANAVSVDGRLRPASLAITDGCQWLVTGANGVGKSTLLSVLDGSVPPDEGQVLRQPGVRIARLAQDPCRMDPDQSPRQWFDSRQPGPGGPLLVEFGLIQPRDVDRPLGELSEGQRRRLALAGAIATAPHLLLLDEPTDHLSLNLVEELEDALAVSPGAVVVASHDRWLQERWDGEVLRLQ